MANGVLVKDPTTGAFTLAPGAGSAPLGAIHSANELGIGGATAAPGGTGQPNGATGTDPYTAFNMQIASMLKQIQQSASSGRAGAMGAENAMGTEAVGAAGGYNPEATPGVNIQNTTGTMGAFAPAITSIATQVQSTDTALKDLEGSIGAIQSANQPETLSPGSSLVTKGGQVLINGTAYSAQVDPLTGKLTVVPLNSLGQPQGGGTGSGSGSGGNTSSIEAIFGKSNPIGAYATDPNYVKEISGLYSTIESLGVASNAQMLDQYIKNNAGNAPVSGQMILNAAKTYHVDPALIATVLLHESDFGTAGVGAKTMNPGNQGNTGSSTQSFQGWQQGVNATANNIANRMGAVTGSGSDLSGLTSPDTSALGGKFAPEVATKVSQLPPILQNYVDAGPKGVAYFNAARVPDTSVNAVKTYGASLGIPFLTADESQNVKNIGLVYDSMKKMQALVSSTLGTGFTGRAAGLLVNPGLKYSQILSGPDLKQFEQYRSQAINNLKALTAGGTTFRITQTEIDTAVDNIPGITDNQEAATKDLTTLGSFMDSKLASTFPYTSNSGPGGSQTPEGTTHQYQGITYVMHGGQWVPQH